MTSVNYDNIDDIIQKIDSSRADHEPLFAVIFEMLEDAGGDNGIYFVPFTELKAPYVEDAFLHNPLFSTNVLNRMLSETGIMNNDELVQFIDELEVANAKIQETEAQDVWRTELKGDASKFLDGLRNGIDQGYKDYMLCHCW